ncbi:hypothetical protein [Nocardiopsis suaedae]|uniref:DUF3307 domain-containing protein n=1 Tax=Nocardiopsis suaedae TaxID=3018444 RepID=A0ABT4TIC3_9ACTN|nr:hypothetical protein [Nocardiopsis suaedae]MDA2804458.1 hypothetical protein [Nocardiopsis suaedae]
MEARSVLHADPTTALLTIAALTGGHYAGDYLFQTDHQATNKGRCDHQGRRACTGHVAALTLAQLLLLALVAVVTQTALEPLPAALGLAVNAGTHWWADRRAPLRGLVLATDKWFRKRDFYDNGPGAPLVDQAWHKVWLIPAGLVAASPPPLALILAAACAGLLAAADIASRRALQAEEAARHQQDKPAHMQEARDGLIDQDAPSRAHSNSR